ncbi:hypothetical protein [Haladaptatus sp. CMSO5]|uniref:hypothetical protein n=1 Tax=Haladaptatus sp. CMSO5 TaxID=3120514 RepID=UPI002FCE4AD5
MTGTPESRPSRRDVLRLGSLAVVGALAGCSSNRPTEQPPSDGPDSPGEQPSYPYDVSEFDRVVNMQEVGADPTGATSIVPLLTAHAASNTVLYFPRGRYLMDDIWEFPRFDTFGIIGDGAVIVPERGYDRYLFNIGTGRASPRGFLFAGIEFDFSAPNTSPRPLQVTVADRLVVRDVRAFGPSGAARFSITDPEGTGLVERLSLHNDGDMEAFSVGIFVGPDSVGELTFTDCEVSGFPNNGLYASSSVGPVYVFGGSYQNNGIANVRVSSPAEVRGVHVRCDASPPGFQNMRGIRLRNGDSILVDDCTVEMLDVTYSEGGIVIESDMASALIRNTTIITSADRVPAIHAKTLGDVVGSVDGAIRCESVTISGDASEDAAIRIVDRDNSVLEDVHITQSGSNRNGIHLLRANNTLLRNVDITVTSVPVVLEQSGFVSENVTINTAR